MVITVISFKGGVGKSTVSQNLAVSLAHQGKDVCIIDADENESSNIWYSFRPEELPSVPVFHVTNRTDMSKTINTLSERFDIVIIDCPPAVKDTTSRAVAKSDFSLIPITPTGGSDVWATEKFLEHISLLRDRLDAPLPCYFVVNRYETNVTMHKAYLNALGDYMEKYKVDWMNTILHKRSAYGEANANGMGVVEYENPKAKKEINDLTKEVMAIVQLAVES